MKKLLLIFALTLLLCMPAFASGGTTGNVAGVVEQTWKAAAGQFEWSGPVILFACLVLTLTAPLYIWTIIGI